MARSRLQFALHDLEGEIRNIAKLDGDVEIVLPAEAFAPVAGELASQYGTPLVGNADRIRCGGVVLRKAS